MDPFDEKAALEKETQNERTVVSPSDSSTPDILVDEPEKEITSDPEKQGDLWAGTSQWEGTDRERHLSVELADDRHKRESVETARPRPSNLTEKSSIEGFRSSAAEELDDEGRPRFLSPPGSPAIPRPENQRGLTGASATTVGASSKRSMPSLRRRETKLAQKHAHPWQHIGITLGLPAMLLFDIAIPLIVYYVWWDRTGANWRGDCEDAGFTEETCPTPRPEYNSDILGYSIISFGIGEIWILGARVWRLFFHQEDCAPLLSRSRWELDATSWVYLVAIILALIPFVVGAEKEQPELYLYSPAFIMVFLGVLMVITMCCPIKIPIGINSHARGSKLRPFIYYAAEDFIAVDGLQDREFRVRFNDRYETNKMFRRFFVYLTLWWIFGVLVYIGCLSAVIWLAPFHVAFGVSLGVLFGYIIIWAATTKLWVDYEMKREHRAYENDEIEP